MSRDIHKKKHLSSFQLIILGFAGVILLGAIILMLPVSSAEGVMTPFNQTLFTSTSAVCVTGLAVLDTGSYWCVWTGSDFTFDTDRRTWCGYCCRFCIYAVRQKDFSDAAQHDAECNFCT